MPCLNEENTVAICVTKALACFARLGLPGEVVVADNGSTDRSVDLAEQAGARVVHVKTKGYGAALIAGIKAARGGIIIMGDSDDSYDWSNLDGFIKGIEAGNDLVMGNRFRGGIEPGAMPPLHRYLGNPVLSLVSKLAFKVPISDFHCGMRAFTQEAFRRMEPGSTGMEFATEMVANAAHIGLKMAEIPIRLYPDKRDRPPHLRSFRDGWRHLRYILSHAPDHVFMWPGALMVLAGMALVLPLLRGPVTIGSHYFGVHFVILGAMFCLIGATIIPMGVMAKMILGLGPPNRSRFLRTFLSRSRLLEGTVGIGGLALLWGLAIDALLLRRWLNTASGMEDTVHLAIAGSTAIVIGIEIIFFAFLLFLARERLEKDNSFGSNRN
jgi:glycosyltransferase involved in cell wall biosynthesis